MSSSVSKKENCFCILLVFQYVCQCIQKTMVSLRWSRQFTDFDEASFGKFGVYLLVKPTVLSQLQTFSLFLPQSRIPTDTLSLIGQSDRSAQQAGSLSQVTGTGVGHSIVPTEILLRGGGLWANSVTRHTVGIISLVHHACRTAWTENIPTGLWNKEGNTLILNTLIGTFFQTEPLDSFKEIMKQKHSALGTHFGSSAVVKRKLRL